MTNTLASVVLAIWTVEGGDRASVPYGILSVPVRDKEEARQVCQRTVTNNLRRWREAGRPGCYFDFLGDRYVGANDPKGRANWKRNVRVLLNHQQCKCKP